LQLVEALEIHITSLVEEATLEICLAEIQVLVELVVLAEEVVVAAVPHLKLQILEEEVEAGPVVKVQKELVQQLKFQQLEEHVMLLAVHLITLDIDLITVI
jgi:hypothetical protein